MGTRRALVVALALVACAENPPVESTLDEPYFRCQVQPVLEARCAMLACHGDEVRPLRIYARNRLRLDAEDTQLNLPMSDEELALNYANAAAFVDDDPDTSFLLRKPLDEAAGGYYHAGRELFDMGDVFTDTEDVGYQVLRAWAEGEVADPACVYAGQEAP
ncbi:MAG: hypothetical protein R3A51_22685 [Nannocystaceae bacterium]|nr:hypothetical protein [Myxococcales bacterium]